MNGETFSVTGTGATDLSSKNVQTNQLLANVTNLALGTSGNGGLSANYNALSTVGSSVSITAKALTVSGINVSGTDSGNYTLGNTTADITAKALTATVAAPNKTYDGTAAATPTLSIKAGLVGAETVTATGTATFNSKDVATANLVTVNSTALANGTSGVYGVRAYPQGEGSGDQGWLTNFELRHSYRDNLQGVVFYDAGQATVSRNPFAAGANSRYISGAGLAVNATLAGVQFKAYLAWHGAGGQPQSEPATINRSPRLWVQAGKQF